MPLHVWFRPCERRPRDASEGGIARLGAVAGVAVLAQRRLSGETHTGGGRAGLLAVAGVGVVAHHRRARGAEAAGTGLDAIAGIEVVALHVGGAREAADVDRIRLGLEAEAEHGVGDGREGTSGMLMSRNGSEATSSAPVRSPHAGACSRSAHRRRRPSEAPVRDAVRVDDPPGCGVGGEPQQELIRGVCKVRILRIVASAEKGVLPQIERQVDRHRQVEHAAAAAVGPSELGQQRAVAQVAGSTSPPGARRTEIVRSSAWSKQAEL